MPEITLQPDASAGIDAGIIETDPTANHGADTFLGVGYDDVSAGGKGYSSILIKFDLSAIALGSIIQEATLALTHHSQSATDTMTFSIHRVLPANSAWDEGATWNTKDGSAAWEGGSSGCDVPGTDHEVDSMGVYTHGNAVITPDPIVLIPSVFQRLIDLGNYGMLIRCTIWAGGTDRTKRVRTSDHATAGDRPALFVRWLEPSGRLVKYSFDIFAPIAIIKDSKGAVVQPNEVRPDNWWWLMGIEIPSPKVYDDLVEDPRAFYGVSTDFAEDAVDVNTDRNQFAEMIIRRAAGGGS